MNARTPHAREHNIAWRTLPVSEEFWVEIDKMKYNLKHFTKNTGVRVVIN